MVVLGLLAAPVLMASQNWDDHDRSEKRTALANAKTYLDSCEKDAILFTIGDNDTFHFGTHKKLKYASRYKNCKYKSIYDRLVH